MQRLFAVALITIISSGCAGRKAVQLALPDSAKEISAWLDAVNTTIADPKISAPTDAIGKRNLAISYTTALIMAHYGSVRTKLMSGRAASSIAFDVLDLGTTTGIPITNGARGKTILGALATGFKGTQLSIDRNLFNQQTTGAILTAMDTCVLRQRSLLNTKRGLPVADYSIFDGYSDLVSLYGCTTLAGAMEELVETQSVAARQEKTMIVSFTKQEADQLQEAQVVYMASVNGDKKAALEFLTIMGVTSLTAQSANDKFIDAYRELGFRAVASAADKTKFLDAATKVGLIKTQ